MLAAARATLLTLASVTALFVVAPLAGAKTGTIYTVAGTGAPGTGGDGGLATAAQLSVPVAVEQLADGGLLIVEQGSSRVRRVGPDGIITTIAGNGTAGFADDDGPATEAQLNAPNDVAVRADGGILIADSNNNRIRLVLPSGIISTVAGTGIAGYNGDGIAATTAQLNFPAGVAVTADGGFLISDNDNHRIRKVDAAGTITTLAGDGTAFSSGNDGPAVLARINDPGAIVALSDGAFAFTEVEGRFVRMVDSTGIISRVAGNGSLGFDGDGSRATFARFNLPIGLAAIPGGGFLIGDTGNARVRRVDASGFIYTVAGTGVFGGIGDGGLATEAQLNNPIGVAIAPDGDYLIADATNQRIRRVDAGDLPGPPPPPPPPPGRNLTPPAVNAGIAINRKTTYGCDPGTWEGVPTPPPFEYTWWRGSPVVAIGEPKPPVQVASTDFFTPTGADLGQPISCKVTVRDLAGNVLEAESATTIITGSVGVAPVLKQKYGNVRVRGIDVFQIVQPTRGATMYGLADEPFALDCGGGTPSPWVENCGATRPAEPQEVFYKGVKLDARKPTTAIVYVDMDNVPPSSATQPLDVTLRAYVGNGQRLNRELKKTKTNPELSRTPWVTSLERMIPEYGVAFDLPDDWLAAAAASGERLHLEARVALPLGAQVEQCSLFVATARCYADDRFRLFNVDVSDRFPDLTIRSVALLTHDQSLIGPNALAPPERVMRKALELFPGGERITVLPYSATVDIDWPAKLQLDSPYCSEVRTLPDGLRICRVKMVHNAVGLALAGRDSVDRASYNIRLGVHRYFEGNDGKTVESGWTTPFYTLSNSTEQAGLGSLPTFYANDGTAGLARAAAHELGHIMGLEHAGQACGGNDAGQVGEIWPPDFTGRLQGVAMQRATIRLGRQHKRVFDTDAQPLFDLMSYCASEADAWLSPRNWNRIAAVLRAFRDQTTARVPAAVRRATAEVDAAFALGVVTPDGGLIQSVGRAAAGSVTPPIDPESAVVVRALAADGTPLADVGARLEPLVDGGGGVATFRVPLPDGTAAVELRRGDTLLHRLDRSRPPTVKLLAPTTSRRVRATDTLGVRWSASDPDGDALMVSVEYSANGSTGWRSVFSGPSTGRAAVPGRFLEPGRRGRVRVVVTDGFGEARAVSAPFAAAGIAPVAMIVTPEAGTPQPGGGRVALTGSAVDAAGKHLRGRALTWFAGTKRLGTGERLRVTLPVGRTTLRLRARDAGGRETVVTRTLTVDPIALRLTRLQAPARVQAAARTATLTVAASRAVILRAGGRTFTIGTAPRKLAIPLPARPKTGVLRLTVRVGDAGKKPAIQETLLVLRI